MSHALEKSRKVSSHHERKIDISDHPDDDSKDTQLTRDDKVLLHFLPYLDGSIQSSHLGLIVCNLPFILANHNPLLLIPTQLRPTLPWNHIHLFPRREHHHALVEQQKLQIPRR